MLPFLDMEFTGEPNTTSFTNQDTQTKMETVKDLACVCVCVPTRMRISDSFDFVGTFGWSEFYKKNK